MVESSITSLSLGNEIRRLLETEIGEVGVLTYKKQCWDLGLNPDSVSLKDVPLIARGVARAITPIIGQDRSKNIEKRMQRIKLLEEMKDTTREQNQQTKARKAVNLEVALGETCLALKEYEEAKKYFRQAARDGVTSSLPIMEARAYRGTAHIHRELSEWDEAERWFKKAIDLSKSVGDNVGMIDSWRGLGRVYWSLGRFKEAKQAYTDALEGAEKLKDAEVLGITLIDMGNVHNEKGELDIAEKLYARAAPLLEEKKNYEELARAYNNLGDIMLQRKEWKKAISYFNKCKEEGEKILSERMPGWALFNIAEAQMNLGEYDKAKDNITHSLSLLRVVDDPRGISSALKLLGDVHCKKKEWSKADEAFDESLKYAQRTNSPHYLARTYVSWATSKKAQGKKAEAKKLTLSAKDVLEGIDVPEITEKLKELMESLGL